MSSLNNHYKSYEMFKPMTEKEGKYSSLQGNPHLNFREPQPLKTHEAPAAVWGGAFNITALCSQAVNGAELFPHALCAAG